MTSMQELLERRARRYAQRPADALGDIAEAVLFERGGTRFAVALTSLREVSRLGHFCTIPGASAVVPGVFAHRGRILSGHDLAAFLGAPAPTLPDWALVVEHGELRIGLLADEILHVVRYPLAQVGPAPLTLGERLPCFLGLLGDATLLLDTATLLRAPAFARAFPRG